MHPAKISPTELTNRLFQFSVEYFLIDARHDREVFYSLSEQELKEYPFCINGVFLNLVMDGELDKAWELIEKLGDSFPYPLMKYGLILVCPTVSWKQFIQTLNKLKETNMPLTHVVLTAGRPYLLNGFNDFSRLGPHLERHKELFMEDLRMLYEGECVPFIYKLCLAEYKYQKNELIDAELLVSSTIKEFDRNSERRLLFAALFLQSKIILSHDKTVSADSFIKNIRRFTKKEGELEFSLNIEAAHILFSLYEGRTDLAIKWLSKGAPDEFGDFNMLDLYRYMVKIRCYIITKNYAAVIALGAKLQPLLEEGRRHMDNCELSILSAIAFYRAGKKDTAFEYLEKALKLVKRRNYFRMIADEGEAIMPVLVDYANSKNLTTSAFLMNLIEMTRDMSIYHPLYLKDQLATKDFFTPMEIDVLRLLEQGKSKEQIGGYFFISVNTVKYHLKKIYSKLGATSAHQAVWEARAAGVI